MAQGDGSRSGGGLGVFLALLALAAVAVNFYGDMRTESNSQEVLSQLRSAFITPEVIRKTEASVYYVETSTGMMATAFVVDRAGGLLATNAHVALNFKGPDTVKVISLDGEKIPVEAAFIHDGWNDFGKHVKAYEPALTMTAQVQGRPVEFPYPIRLPAAYDVGLLKVAAEDAGKLAADLPIASREALMDLSGGDVIASIGYPGQMSATEGLDHVALTPKTTAGRIMAASSFMGSKLDDASNPLIAQLILHPLHTQPGTSGSPMINEKGEVIAVNQGAFQRMDGAGDARRIEEVGERVGHRADILHDLLEGKDTEQIKNTYRPLWDRQLDQFEQMPDATVRLLAPFMSKPRDFESAKINRRSLTFDEKSADPKYQLLQNQHTLTTQVVLDPTKVNLVMATDFRGSVGGCNPNFQIAFPNGTSAFAQAFQTKHVRVYRMEIPAGYTDVSSLPIRFYEPEGCNSIGETMRLHVYSWDAEDIVAAEDRSWPYRALASLRSFLKQAVNGALDYLQEALDPAVLAETSQN